MGQWNGDPNLLAFVPTPEMVALTISDFRVIPKTGKVSSGAFSSVRGKLLRLADLCRDVDFSCGQNFPRS